MALIQLILQNIFSFAIIISAIVFVHEFGHFIVARLCGVKVEQFSIGFGKKLFSFKDKRNTQWQFCLLPIGGFVKMYGDSNSASVPDYELIKKMTKQEREISFIAKNVYQRIAIVFAGPLANILLTILIFTFLFRINGITKVLPKISEVVENSPAFIADLRVNDEITKVDGQGVHDFNDIRKIINFAHQDEIEFEIKRNEKILLLKIKPEVKLSKDFFGEEVKVKMIGIVANEIFHQKVNLWESFINANLESYDITKSIFIALGELITGKRSIQELGGPIKIAKYSTKTFSMGISVVFWFGALISLNLAIMNLLPIPVLDGGHLFFYFCEAIFRKPIPIKIQQFGYKIGLILVLSLMIFTTTNDVWQLFK
jgi:regulator of sigma E protease